MARADVNGVQINYELVGAGPLIVLNHGLGGSLDMFRDVVPRLSGDFSVLTWDNRGCGSSTTRGPYSLRVFSEDLFGLLKALGFETCILYGVSWGGVVALRFTLDHPEMVRALMIDSSSSELNERAAQGWLARGRAVLAARKGEGAATPLAPGTPVQASRQGEGLGGHALRDDSFDPRVDPDAFMGQCAAVASMLHEPMTPELPRITCPTTCIVGESDNVAGVGGTVIASRNIPGAKLVIVPNCGHGVVRGATDVWEAELRELAVNARREGG